MKRHLLLDPRSILQRYLLIEKCPLLLIELHLLLERHLLLDPRSIRDGAMELRRYPLIKPRTLLLIELIREVHPGTRMRETALRVVARDAIAAARVAKPAARFPVDGLPPRCRMRKATRSVWAFATQIAAPFAEFASDPLRPLVHHAIPWVFSRHFDRPMTAEITSKTRF